MAGLTYDGLPESSATEANCAEMLDGYEQALKWLCVPQLKPNKVNRADKMIFLRFATYV